MHIPHHSPNALNDQSSGWTDILQQLTRTFQILDFLALTIGINTRFRPQIPSHLDGFRPHSSVFPGNVDQYRIILERMGKLFVENEEYFYGQITPEFSLAKFYLRLPVSNCWTYQFLAHRQLVGNHFRDSCTVYVRLQISSSI